MIIRNKAYRDKRKASIISADFYGLGAELKNVQEESGEMRLSALALLKKPIFRKSVLIACAVQQI